MEKKFLSISEAAEYLGISDQTLRRWDKDGTFPPTFVSSGGHRHYSLAQLERQTKGLFQIAKDWATAKEAYLPPEEYFCPTIEKFKTRLERMALEMNSSETLKEVGSLASSAAGEIGNNSFEHNIGNWPDVKGAFFAYDLGKRIIVLADRGRGVRTTLLETRPELKDDKEALLVAFTQMISGRAPEHRGNGLKYVKNAVTKFGFHLTYQSGDAKLEIKKSDSDLAISTADASVRGCLVALEF